MVFEYAELAVLLTRLIPLECNPNEFESKRDAWEQTKLNNAIKKIESEATRMRNEERKEKLNDY